MWRQADGTLKDILNALAYDCKALNDYITTYAREHRCSKIEGYRASMKTSYWREMRKHMLAYYKELDGALYCKICGKKLGTKGFVLHHVGYHFEELGCPLYCKFICKEHHTHDLREI